MSTLRAGIRARRGGRGRRRSAYAHRFRHSVDTHPCGSRRRPSQRGWRRETHGGRRTTWGLPPTILRSVTPQAWSPDRHVIPRADGSHAKTPRRNRAATPPPFRRDLGPAIVVALLIAGCGDDAGDSAGNDGPVTTSQIDVDDNVFRSESVEIVTGSDVTWTWVGSNDHNVVADGFSSDTKSSGMFRHTFEEAGTYDYRCTLHPGMVGTVVVTEAVDGGGT